MCNQETIEWAKDAANFLRQNGSYTHAERIIELCEYASSNLKEMTEDQARDYADMRKFQDRFISASRRIDQLEAELAEARRDGERLAWAWANPGAFLEAKWTTPPDKTGREQIDAARGGAK